MGTAALSLLPSLLVRDHLREHPAISSARHAHGNRGSLATSLVTCAGSSFVSLFVTLES
ncbi:hypothetical protein J6590_068453 [Homalodisca vitripennis]|nr:hypothetical protein J6590_068453 [Homalodisca vitripennis]